MLVTKWKYLDILGIFTLISIIYIFCWHWVFFHFLLCFSLTKLFLDIQHIIWSLIWKLSAIILVPFLTKWDTLCFCDTKTDVFDFIVLVNINLSVLFSIVYWLQNLPMLPKFDWQYLIISMYYVNYLYVDIHVHFTKFNWILIYLTVKIYLYPK